MTDRRFPSEASRDPDPVQALRRVLPDLVCQERDGAPLRAWVPFCATGELAYAIAVLLTDLAQHAGAAFRARIFATDLDEAALRVARTARYPPSLPEALPSLPLTPCFVPNQDGYQASETLRAMCIFSEHDLFRDPPISRLDLLACGGIKTVPDEEVRRHLSRLFHFALRPGGLLIAGGAAEFVSAEHFAIEDEARGIFRRRDETPAQLPIFPRHGRSAPHQPRRPPAAIDLPVAHSPGPVRERLRRTVEELRRKNDELQGANEELQCSRGEVDSANRDLEFANAQLQAQLEEVDRLRADLDNLLTSLRIPTLFLDRSLQIKWFSPAAVEVFHLVETDVGRPLSDLRARIWGIDFTEEARAVLREETPRDLPVTRPAEFPGEKARHYSARILPYLSRSKRTDGVVITFSDITDRVREELLREQARHKDEFLAMLGHELRNPLAAIANANELQHLIETYEPRLQKTIGRQVRQMVRLIDDLLEVSRLARGKVKLERVAFDLSELVTSAIEDHHGLAKSGVEVELCLPDEPVWVEGDRERLTQAADNLLGNAAKFTPSSGTVTVSVAARGDLAEVRVSDTGIGVELALLEQLFEPFRQAPQSLARAGGGLGLGLALVKQIVELHGGRVSAWSEGPGRGAEFAFSLPHLEAGAQVEREEQHSPPLGPMRILLVEDNLDAAEILAEMLEVSGHEVILAHDAREGLRTAKEWAPHVILCDIGLPGDLDGYGFARRVREDHPVQPKALIALSGYGRPEDKERGRAAGFDAHLAKPIDLSSLERAIGIALASRGQALAP